MEIVEGGTVGVISVVSVIIVSVGVVMMTVVYFPRRLRRYRKNGDSSSRREDITDIEMQTLRR